MKLFLTVLALCASLMGVTSQASAAAFGSSIMNTSNLRLQYFNGSSWVDATSAQATIVDTAVTSRSSATLGGTNFTSGRTTGLNAVQSFVSSTSTPPTEQTSALVGLGQSPTSSFAYGDTWGNNGSTLISAGGIASSTLAEVNALPPLSGTAFGNINNTSIFEVRVSQGGQYQLAFTANLSMQAVDGGYATNSFGVGVSQSQIGGTVSLPTDNAAWNASLASLNRSISGSSNWSVSTSFFSPVFTLASWDTGASDVTFNITQASTAGTAVVPEPSSMAIFGLMSAGSILAWRRRRV
ncbi:MAG: PEP-CTERM sorting domain-containing protein [Planctomycetota bacterium]|nr:PEP-CTERM sorting domain-containing protein [Planctomycetota bacterium]